MNVALIGGAGFIGTRLARRLEKSGTDFCIYDISVANRDNPRKVHVDVVDMSSLSVISKPDVIVNLAAVHRDDVRPLSRYDEVNVQGARNVCAAAEQLGVNKIVFTSSVAIYGFAPPGTGEDGQVNYFNDYGRTKWLAEGVFREWQQRDPSTRCLVIVRPTVVFGEGNRGNVYNLLKQIYSRRFMMFGPGENCKSMAYVENVAAFLQYSLSFQAGVHIYNYIDKPDFTMNQLVTSVRKFLFGKNNVGPRMPAALGVAIGYMADVIAKVTDKSLPISSIRVKKFMGTTQFSSAASKTGFVPAMSLEEGLHRTLKYEFLDDNSGKRVFETE